MRARHRRRSRVAFPAVVAALVAVVAGVVLAAAGGDGGPTGRAAVPTGSATQADSSGASDAATPPAQPPKRGKLVIDGTGDVSLDPLYIPTFASRGYGWAWSGLGGLFRHDDLTVVNLECPATDVIDPVSKEFDFRCDPAGLPAARRAGVEVANQGNNHAFDQGADGLVDSLRRIRAAGILPVGAGRNQEQALAPASLDLEGWRVAVIGIDEVLDPIDMVAGPDTPGTAAGHDFSLALRAIRAAAARSDVVVVAIHWGIELDTQPRAYQVQEAHRMVEAGADVIFGHHSHRLQPMETYRGRPIFYGLGNFVWPRLSAEGARTAVARVTVSPSGRFRGRLLPAEIVSDGHPVLR